MYCRMKSVCVALTILASISYSCAREISSPPRIVKQPPGNEIFVNTDNLFYLECEAIGQPSPKYRWVKNGKPFDWQTYDGRINQEPGQGTLTFVLFRDTDQGIYQCFAENEFGVAASNAAFVRISKLNSFRDHSQIMISGNEGEPFKLSCSPPDGNPQPIISWILISADGGMKSINNSRLTTDPEGNLWFSNLTKDDASDYFMYACAAVSTNKFEYKLGTKVSLDVIPSETSLQNKHEPTFQYISRKNMNGLLGKSTELYCIFGGTPLPEISWLMNDVPVEFSDRIVKRNYGKSLLIKSVELDDHGIYTCKASNGIGDAKSYLTYLNILAAPYFTEQPEYTTVAVNETIEFRCVASGIPKPKIQWIFNSKPIEEAAPNNRRKVDKNSIVIENLTIADIGNYGCNASNALGYIYKDAYVNVLALAPEIIELPTDKEVVTGQQVKLNCKVFGAPKPNIKFVHNGEEFFGDYLHIIHVQHNDAGQYLCQAENIYGILIIHFALIVKEHTRVIVAPKDSKIKVKDMVVFHCNAISDEHLHLEVMWLKNEQKIDFGQETRFIKSSNFSLSINKLTSNDSGTYTCVAKTRLDEVNASATLTVQDVPNPPLLTNVQCLNQKVILNWVPMGDQDILHYEIEFNGDNNLGVWKTVFDEIPSANLSFIIPINSSGNYSFGIKAWNKIGPSEPSHPSATCIIKLDVPYKNPGNVHAEGTQPDNLVITWTPMPLSEHNGPDFFYTVYWKRDIPGENYYSENVTNWQQSELVLSNQPPFQQFCIKVSAGNALGEASTEPVVVTGYSGEDVPKLAPTHFRLINISSPTTILLKWHPVLPDSVRGHLKGYKIKISAKNNSNVQEVLVDSTTTTAEINCLLPHVKYYAQICVYNCKYDGPLSDILSFDMPEGVPSKVASLNAWQLSSTALYLKWEKPELSNGVLLGYNIKYATVHPGNILGGFVSRNPSITDPNRLQAKLSGLKPNKNYRINVTARTKAGESKPFYIEHTLQNTTSSVPSIPDFEWQIMNYDKRKNKLLVKVTWLPNFNGNPGSHFYVVFKKKLASDYVKTPPEYNEDYIVIYGLADLQQYEFALVAVDGNFETKGEIQDIYFNAAHGNTHNKKKKFL